MANPFEVARQEALIEFFDRRGDIIETMIDTEEFEFSIDRFGRPYARVRVWVDEEFIEKVLETRSHVDIETDDDGKVKGVTHG